MAWTFAAGCAEPGPVQSPAGVSADDPVLDADCAGLVPYYQKLPGWPVCSFTSRGRELPVLRASVHADDTAEVEKFLSLSAPSLGKLQRYARRMRGLTRLGWQCRKELLEALARRDANAYRARSPDL